MKATISLDPSDLLKIARLVHDTPHELDKDYDISYVQNGIYLDVNVTQDSSFGYCVNDVSGYSIKVAYYLPSDIKTQIENVL